MASRLALTSSFSSAWHSAGFLQQLFSRNSRIKSEGGKCVDSYYQGHSQIKYDEVTMSYPTRPDRAVLKDVTLEVTEGTTMAVVGPSGSGKSSLVGLLQRLHDPTSGAIRFCGDDLRSLNLQSLRYQLGLVSQEPVLFSGSIKDNIAYGDNQRQVPMDEIVACASAANIHEFITNLPSGYDTILGKTTQLSGGQKQRIAIARALVRNPKVLLLDEATSALDPESERLVQDALNRAAKGRTTITIAHRPGSVADADIIVSMDSGKIVHVERKEESTSTRIPT